MILRTDVFANTLCSLAAKDAHPHDWKEYDRNRYYFASEKNQFASLWLGNAANHHTERITVLRTMTKHSDLLVAGFCEARDLYTSFQ